MHYLQRKGFENLLALSKHDTSVGEKAAYQRCAPAQPGGTWHRSVREGQNYLRRKKGQSGLGGGRGAARQCFIIDIFIVLIVSKILCFLVL